MTTLHDDQTATDVDRFCPECGQPVRDSNFDSRSGHNMRSAADWTPHGAPLPPPNAGLAKPGLSAVFIIAAVVLGLIAVAVVVILLH